MTGDAERENVSSKNASVSAIGIVVTKLIGMPFNMLVSLIVASALGPIDKGYLAGVIAFSSFATGLATLGFPAGTKFLISSREYTVKQVGSSALAIGLLHGLIGTGILGTFLHLGLLGDNIAALNWAWKLLILILIPLMSCKLIIFRTFAGNSDFRFENVLELVSSLLYSILLVLLVLVFDFGLAGAIIAFGASQITVVIATFAVLFANYAPTVSLDLGFCKKAYAYGFRAWFGTLAKRSNLSLDQFLLAIIAKPEALGNYSVAMTIAKLFWILPQAVAPVLMNRVAESASNSQIELTTKLHRAMLLMTGAASIVVVAGTPIVFPLVLPDYSDVPLLLLILMPGAILLTLYRVLGSFFSGSGRPGRASLAQSTALIVSLLGYPTLIPLFGGYGAAMISTATYLVSYGVMNYLFQRDTAGQRNNLFKPGKTDFDWIALRISTALVTIRNRVFKQPSKRS